ncbi:minichromosome maintenance domain-containing protein 2 [Aedes albopictus]|uniref:MCM AAA-lid domain-containing protein n=1 Tax=Aedes albopictus TaxID=7160 RepID=A0ABM1Y8M2_AEDAL|nr:minichromosome maintenance domain-containing protein 2-like [Aedes albopictus]
MESTMGLMSDPDEFGGVGRSRRRVGRGSSDEVWADSMRVQVSKQTEREVSSGIITECEMLKSRESETAFGGDDSDEEILSLLEVKVNDQLTQAFTLTGSSQDNKERYEKSLQPTFMVEAIETSQAWQFTQTLVGAQQTQDSQIADLTQDSSIHVKLEDTTSSTPMYQELSEIPASIRRLYSSVVEKYSDYCFSYMLAAQLCQEEIPMCSFNECKLSLLLSIASIRQTSQSYPFHVIVLGSDTSISHLAMTSVGRLARRFMAGMFDPLAGGRVLEDNFVECGATTLSRTGICYVGDWAMLKPSQSTRIMREIESGQVIIENHSIVYPLECAIWSYWNYTRKAKQDLSTIIMFLNAFGIPIVQPEQTPEAVMDFILERSLVGYEPSDQPDLVPQEDIHQFLTMLYYQEVRISEAAAKLLSDYFVATRLNVQESLTQTSFSALNKLTEAHARLCFRTEATRMDAVVAIMICERFVHSVFSNPGNAAPLSDSFDTIDDLEQHLYRFDRWLKDFLRNMNRV